MENFYDIAWDIKAGEDLNRIYVYLLDTTSELTAQKVKKAIITAIGRLRTQPESFPRDPLLQSRPENFR